MPIECALLRDQPVPIDECPKCGAAPFEPFLRGSVQRRRLRFLIGPPRPFCTLICSECKEIVGHEDVPKRAIDDTIERKRNLKILLQSVAIVAAVGIILLIGVIRS